MKGLFFIIFGNTYLFAAFKERYIYFSAILLFA